MQTKVKGWLMGFFIVAIGISGWVWTWNRALSEGTYSPKASFFFPFATCLGLAVFFYPITKAEIRARYGTEQIPWKHIPLGAKLLVLIGMVLGFVQWAIFAGHISL